MCMTICSSQTGADVGVADSLHGSVPVAARDEGDEDDEEEEEEYLRRGHNNSGGKVPQRGRDRG